MQAIETRYAGCRFRSRLEARWAVFFNTLGILWNYEPEGFELKAGRYLPDFWLPQVGMYAEVKPGPFSPHELTLCAQLAFGSSRPVLLLDGQPAPRPYLAFEGAEFIDETWNIFGCYHDLGEGHRYWEDEARFYTADSWGDGIGGQNPNDLQITAPLTLTYATQWAPAEWSDGNAIRAALSARFEFGEEGPGPAPSSRGMIGLPPGWSPLNLPQPKRLLDS